MKLLVACVRSEPARRLWHEDEARKEHNGKENVASVRETPTFVPFLTANVGSRSNQDTDSDGQLPERAKHTAVGFWGALGNVDGDAHGQSTNRTTGNEATNVHHGNDRSSSLECGTNNKDNRRRKEASAATPSVGHVRVENSSDCGTGAKQAIDRALLGIYLVLIERSTVDGIRGTVPIKVLSKALHDEGRTSSGNVVAKQ